MPSIESDDEDHVVNHPGQLPKNDTLDENFNEQRLSTDNADL